MRADFIDLRSDTVTAPTAAMRDAMAKAEVGDDVYQEDPTMNRLHERVAELLGKEAVLFVPSGTMSNQMAIRIHTRSGDEMLCEECAHLNRYEGGGPASLSGVTCRTAPGQRGILDVDDFVERLHPENVHLPRTRLVALENTHNMGGGTVVPLENIERISAWARGEGIAMHLDGARLMNAVVASGISADRWAGNFDTVSICFSKGLGAPVGSALAGSKELIHEAHRVRKMFGGGMRQAGILAAACLHALDHHVDRLAEDHANARILGEAFDESDGFDVRLDEIDTNLVWFHVDRALGTAQEVADRFRERGVLVGALGVDLMRVVTHLDVDRSDCERAADVIREVAADRK